MRGPWRIALLAVLLASFPAQASPHEDPAISGGVLFAGPTRPHGTSIYLNPAAMGIASRGAHLLLQANLRIDQLQVDRTLVDPAGNTSAGPSANSISPTPGGIVALDVSPTERLRIGLAVYAPIADRFVSNKESLRYHSLGGNLYQFTTTAAASVQLADRFHFGFGISLGYTNFDLRYARDTAMVNGSSATRGTASDCAGSACGFENPEASQVLSIKSSTGGFSELFQGQNIGLNVGGLLRIKDNWWIGASAITLPGAALVGGDLDLPGDIRVTDAPRDGGGTFRGDAELQIRTTQYFYLGVRGPVTQLFDLVVTGRWANWSQHRGIDVRAFGGTLDSAGESIPSVNPRFRGFRDVFTLDGGLESAGSERYRYGARARIESGAVSGERATAIVPDGLNLGALLGGELRLGDHIVLGGTYGFSYYLPMDASTQQFSPTSRVACVDSGFDFDSCRAFRAGRALPTADGTYKRYQHSLVFSMRYDTL